MGELILLWPERCPAELVIEKDGHQKYSCCNKLAKVGRWCHEHGYKAEIMRIAEKARFPACSVNSHLTISEGWESWWGFALIAPEAWYLQLRPVLRQMEYEKKPHYLNSTHASWRQEATATKEMLEQERLYQDFQTEEGKASASRLFLSKEKPDHECYRCGCLEWEYAPALNNWFCVNRRDHVDPGKRRSGISSTQNKEEGIYAK